jgi:hypothetical protein
MLRLYNISINAIHCKNKCTTVNTVQNEWLRTALKIFSFSVSSIGTIYLSAALESFSWALAASSVSWSYTQSVGLLGRGISPRNAATYTGKHKHRINAHRHPCLEWDSNPQSQCLSGRREFMLYYRPVCSPTLITFNCLYSRRISLKDIWVYETLSH